MTVSATVGSGEAQDFLSDPMHSLCFIIHRTQTEFRMGHPASRRREENGVGGGEQHTLKLKEDPVLREPERRYSVRPVEFPASAFATQLRAPVGLHGPPSYPCQTRIGPRWRSKKPSFCYPVVRRWSRGSNRAPVVELPTLLPSRLKSASDRGTCV